jgi:hypothetical protein
VLAFGDAWFPNYARGADDLADRWQELRDRAERPIDLIVMGVPARAEVLEQLQRAGARRLVRWIPSAGRAYVERALECWESAIAELTGRGVTPDEA